MYWVRKLGCELPFLRSEEVETPDEGLSYDPEPQGEQVESEQPRLPPWMSAIPPSAQPCFYEEDSRSKAKASPAKATTLQPRDENAEGEEGSDKAESSLSIHRFTGEDEVTCTVP